MKTRFPVALVLFGLLFVLTGCMESFRFGDDPKDDLTTLQKAIAARDWDRAISFYEEKYAEPNLSEMRHGKYFLRPYPGHPDAEMFPVKEDDESYSTEFVGDGKNEARVKFYRVIDKSSGVRRPVQIWFKRIKGEWKIIAEVDF